MPPESFERPFLIRMVLVSAFLPEVTQQIHSLRASGVTSFHTASALGAEAKAFRQSAGKACTELVVVTLVVIILILPNLQPQSDVCYTTAHESHTVDFGRHYCCVGPLLFAQQFYL